MQISLSLLKFKKKLRVFSCFVIHQEDQASAI